MNTESSPQYLRASDIVRNRKTGKPGILPICAATWWALVKAKRAPQPLKLSAGVTVWRREDVLCFAESMGKEAA